MLRLEWALWLDADIGGLLMTQLTQLSIECFQLQTRDFFIQVLRQRVNAYRIVFRVHKQLHLRNRLICKGRAHHI